MVYHRVCGLLSVRLWMKVALPLTGLLSTISAAAEDLEYEPLGPAPGSPSAPSPAARNNLPPAGKLVILRDVPPRIAYREAPPGQPRIEVNLSPTGFIFSALGIEDGRSGGIVARALTEGEFALVTGSAGWADIDRIAGSPGSAQMGGGAVGAVSQTDFSRLAMGSILDGQVGSIGAKVTHATGFAGAAIGAVMGANGSIATPPMPSYTSH